MKTKEPRRPPPRTAGRKQPKPRAAQRSASLKLTAKLVPIGNSRGIRLPKSVIEQAGLSGDLELIVGDGEITLRSSRHPRATWNEEFRKAFEQLGPGALEREREEWADWQNLPNDFDEKEWTW